jgi:hypothetical protein
MRVITVAACTAAALAAGAGGALATSPGSVPATMSVATQAGPQALALVQPPGALLEMPSELPTLRVTAGEVVRFTLPGSYARTILAVDGRAYELGPGSFPAWRVEGGAGVVTVSSHTLFPCRFIIPNVPPGCWLTGWAANLAVLSPLCPRWRDAHARLSARAARLTAPAARSRPAARARIRAVQARLVTSARGYASLVAAGCA